MAHQSNLKKIALPVSRLQTRERDEEEAKPSPRKEDVKPEPGQPGQPAHASSRPADHIEHKIIRRATLIPESDLNLLGQDGWEFINAIPAPYSKGEESLFFFKRRKR